RFGSLYGASERSNTLGDPELPHFIREFSVSIAQEKSSLDTLILHPHGRVPALLHDPFAIGMIRGRAVPDPAATQMNVYEHVGRHGAPKGHNLLGEEIARDDGINIGV